MTADTVEDARVKAAEKLDQRAEKLDQRAEKLGATPPPSGWLLTKLAGSA
ncbi:hypothetical protein IFT66_10290 [Rhizobium sp. CFBP 13726]|nr:hypothetical protein [Rhizobium sp. CFBP 13726]MBD8651466.1 hypothetical protein [Rhizobium sp. CFBP 13726]